MKKQVDGAGQALAYNVPLNYSCVMLLADAIERAGSADRGKIIEALAATRRLHRPHHALWRRRSSSTARTQGAAPVNTQVQDDDIKVIFPDELRRREAGLPGEGGLSVIPAGARSAQSRSLGRWSALVPTRSRVDALRRPRMTTRD